jgi:hypothetical protein
LNVLIGFHPDSGTISVTRDSGSESFSIGVDDNYQLFITDREKRHRMSATEADAFSQTILKPLLFPDG